MLRSDVFRINLEHPDNIVKPKYILIGLINAD